MLSSAKIGRGSWRYYQDTVAHGACEYYAERGDAPGRWQGAGLAELGIEPDDPVLERQLEALFARGLHPATGEALGRAWRPDAVTGHDLTFSAPKSVSALWALADPTTATQIREAHTAAVAAALRFLETHASYSRRGRDGVEQIATAGFAAALFDHTTSRTGDPQLHTHALVVNKVHCVDGVWRAIDGHEVFHHKKAAGVLYQSALRAELSTRLGVVFGEVSEHGQAEITGVPEPLLTTWSTRTSAVMADAVPTIADAEADLGRPLTPAERHRIVKTAVLSTRPVKDHTVTAHDLRARWRDQAQQLGITPADLTAALLETGTVADRQTPQIPTPATAGPTVLDGPSVISSAPSSVAAGQVSGSSAASTTAAGLAEPASVGSARTHDSDWSPSVVSAEIDGPAPEVTSRTPARHAALADAVLAAGRGKAIWSRADLVAQVAARIPTLSPDAPTSAADTVRLVEQLADRALATTDSGAVSLGVDPTGVTARASDARYASQETVLLEAAIIERAISRGFRDPAKVGPATAEVLWAGPFARLSREQRQAALRLACSRDLVTVLTAPAGAGKTTTLGAAAALWLARGYQLTPLGPSARAASELAAALDAPGETVARWLTRTSSAVPRSDSSARQFALASRSVVIVDEASMLSTADLEALTARAIASGSRLVLVGDPAQIGAVRAPGGMFEHLTHVLRTRTIRLEELHRFSDPGEAAATLRLRDGDPSVLHEYVAAGRIHPAASSEDAADAVFHQWHQAVTDGQDALMLAQAWTDVTALNERARAVAVATGQVTGPTLLTLTTRTASTRGRPEQRDWRAGDVLLAKKNTRDIPIGGEQLRNGDRFRVRALASDRAGLVVEDLAGRGTTTLSAAYLARHTEYGWASTIDGAQGATTDLAITLARSGLDRERLYVAMTRGRDANHIHTTPEIATGDAGPHPRPQHRGEEPLDLGPLENIAADRASTPGDMGDALALLRRALDTSGRERAAHSLLDPAVQTVREQAFTAREAARRPPGYELESHRIHRDDLTRAHAAVERASANVAGLGAQRAETMARLEGLPFWARKERRDLTASLGLLDQHLDKAHAERDRATDDLESAAQVVTSDDHTVAQQATREAERRHDAWAARDQRPVTDIDADHLHQLATTTPATAEAYEPRRYHQLEPPALEHDAPSA